MTFEAKQISISINKSAADVYEFTSNPENLPKWVPSFFHSIRKDGEYWIADSPLGEAKVKFVEKNNFGILDHYIDLPNGTKVYNPLRVVKNNEGSEVVLTLFRLSGVSDEEYNRDAKAVSSDLKKLKEVIEND